MPRPQPGPHSEDPGDPSRGAGCAASAFGFLALLGLVILVPYFLLPAIEALQSRSWTPVDATVESSRVVASEVGEGDTHSVEITYRYEVDGREYRSSRYDFFVGATSGFGNTGEIVRRYPAGRHTTAWVNPDDPSSAVLYRGFRSDWAFALLPLLFVVTGVGGAAWTLRGGLALRARRAAGIETWRPEETAEGTLTQVIEAPWRPLRRIAGIVLVAGAWNGILGAFAWAWWRGFATGEVDGCLTVVLVLLVPFALIGVLLLAGIPYSLLAALNPRPVVTLHTRTLHTRTLHTGTLHTGTLHTGRLEPGRRVEVEWRYRGRAERIRHLRIVCRGEELAAYGRGTTTVLDRHTFAEIVIADTAAEAARGSAPLDLPEDAMHSFAAPHNQVRWTLHLHATIERWPDAVDDFPLIVQPRATTSR